MSQPFAILRVEKVKNLTHLKARSDHNGRGDRRGTEHVDPDRPPVLLAGQKDAVRAWHDRTDTLNIDTSRLRPDAVVGVEWLATASSSFWESATAEQRTKWTHDTMAFLTEQAGGAGNILNAYLHDDETTPHIQMLSIPAVEKERKKRGRPRKGREAAERPTESGWSLSAKDLIGGPKHRLVEMQDAYAERMEPLGLRRGIPRKETNERNRSPAHWRAEQARLADVAAVNTERATKSRREAHQAAMDVMSIATAKAKEILDAAKAEAKAIQIARQEVVDAHGALEARRRVIDRDALIISAARKQAGQPVEEEVEAIVERAKQHRKPQDTR